MDYFINWLKVYPIPDQEATTVAEALIQQWVSRFGTPLHNGEKINIRSANKQSDELHTAVSVAFSYLLQCRLKTGGKLLLFIVLQWI